MRGRVRLALRQGTGVTPSKPTRPTLPLSNLGGAACAGDESYALAALGDLDGHTPSHRALRLLRRENPKWKYVEVRSCKYLNNIIEQDHRAIKRRCASMKGFKSFANAAITIAGIELAHRIHKRQFSFAAGRVVTVR
jgi:hypothetical protein